MQILLGKGSYYISPVRTEDMHGLMCRFTEEEHPIGSKDPDWIDGKKYQPTEKDVFIWCGSLESARVLQDAVNGMILQMNGFKIIEEEELKFAS
jgi:hypothetical protein